MIIIRDLAKRFRLTTRESLTVIHSLSLSVSSSEVISILGPSGCGKTTLLRIIGGLELPTEGLISVSGMHPTEAQKSYLFGFVFQSPVLFPWRTVEENVRLPLEIIKNGHGGGNVPRASAISSMIALMRLDGFETAYPHELSGGMQSRVAFARALVYQPKILLLDEPFGNLDEITRGLMNAELLLILQKTATTVVLVTHSIEEAVTLSDRVMILSDKPSRIVAEFRVEMPRESRSAISRRDSGVFQDYVREIRSAVMMGTGDSRGPEDLREASNVK